MSARCWTGLLIAVALAATLVSGIEANAARRVALVIGNGSYAVGPLANPGNDADAVAAKLTAIGFDKVILRKNLGIDGFRDALGEVAREASGAEIALVYYAGHGTEHNGANYLIPTDAKLERASDLKLQAIALDTVLEQIDGASRLKLVVLDACRNNVFPLAGGKRSVTRGLARIEPENNTLVAYAAAAGTTADDGDGRKHSPFTEALLAHLPTPGVDVRLLFGRVRDDVIRLTQMQQQPHLYGTLGGKEIVLATAPDVESPVAPPLAPSQEANAPIHRCDELAAHPRDPNAKTRGIASDQINVRDATAVCREALTAFPNAPRFMFQLARALTAGNPSDQEAASLYQRASALGYVMAQHNLGILYLEGKAVALDEAKGAELMRQAAAKLGPLNRMYTLAGLSSKLQSSADAGSPGALVELARMTDRGEHILRDVDGAVDLYYKALSSGGNIAFAEMDKNHATWSVEFRRKLQTKLASKGGYSGPADGTVTPAFKDALKAMAKAPTARK